MLRILFRSCEEVVDALIAAEQLAKSLSLRLGLRESHIFKLIGKPYGGYRDEIM